LLQYLENHDERRLASPLVRSYDAHHSGFGSPAAGYQLAPLQYLQSRGPINIYNGQEVGETGAGLKGYNQDDGRTTLFDYWCMPELSRWVNGHRYDGGKLTEDEWALRTFYADLLQLCQDESALAEGQWCLKYHNRAERFADCPVDLYSFARFGAGSRRLMVVAANFRGGAPIEGRLRLPPELIAAAGLPERVTVRVVLKRAACDELVAELESAKLTEDGFSFAIPEQSSAVYIIS
jgi:hypothetical protein